MAAPNTAPGGGRAAAIIVGVLLAAAAFLLYWWSNPVHWNQYNHFVWQADAFLHGRAWFPYPVPAGADLPQNDYLQDVYPLRGRRGRPRRPGAAPVPAAAGAGAAAVRRAVRPGHGPGGRVRSLLAALGVALAWWMLGALRLRSSVRAAGTIVFATGTVWWWAAAVGSTWYLAHLVAVDLALVAVGIALRHDPAAVTESPREEDAPGGRAARRRRAVAGSVLARIRGSAWPLDRSQVLAGFLLGLAVTARLPLIFAAPFFVFTGGGGSAAAPRALGGRGRVPAGRGAAPVTRT